MLTIKLGQRCLVLRPPWGTYLVIAAVVQPVVLIWALRWIWA